MVPSGVWLLYLFSTQNQHFWWLPSLFMVLFVVWFPVLFGSDMFSTQTQHFGWLLSLVMVPSVVWLLSVFCTKMKILGGSSQFLWFPVLFGSNMFSTQNQHFGWFPLLIYDLAPLCFPLKINILGGSLHFLWFPVVFGSNLFSTQNQHFGGSLPFSWFSVLFGSQCCLAPICFPLKVNFLGGSLHSYCFQCCLTPKCPLLMNCWIWIVRVVWTIFDLEQEFWIIWEVSAHFSYIYSSQIPRQNNANIRWLLSGETWKYWKRYMYGKYRTPLRAEAKSDILHTCSLSNIFR